jgi:hypothetical protein
MLVHIHNAFREERIKKIDTAEVNHFIYGYTNLKNLTKEDQFFYSNLRCFIFILLL